MKLCRAMSGILVIGASFSVAGAQSFEPVSIKNPQVIVETGKAAASGRIILLTSSSANTCLQSNKQIHLQPGSQNSVTKVGVTTLAVKRGELKSGNFLCAKIDGGTGLYIPVPAIQISAGPADLLSAPSSSAGSTGAAAAFFPLPAAGDNYVKIKNGPAQKGDQIQLFIGDDESSCSLSGVLEELASDQASTITDGDSTKLKLKNALADGQFLYGATTHDGIVTSIAPVEIKGPRLGYRERTFDYLLLGGFQQSDLSAQSSVSEGFYDLTMSARFRGDVGGIWFRSRYLSAPSSSSKQNIVAATTDPNGALTASNLPQSVNSIDYTIGYQFRDFNAGGSAGQLTITPFIVFGATTPLSATEIVQGFNVPNYGTNECDQLQQRFTSAKGYSPPLPASGIYDSSKPKGCVVRPDPDSTPDKPLPGTQISAIGFSNEDRSSFLLKWSAGIRIVDRWFVSSDPMTWCSSAGGCSRLIADFALGQDQSITGGFLRRFVVKADAIVPIQSSGFYFFAATTTRLQRNQTLSPLILSPVTLATNTATATCTPSETTVCYPSPSVFILPYKQQNRDYYRIGIGIDAKKVLTTLFGVDKKQTQSAGQAPEN